MRSPLRVWGWLSRWKYGTALALAMLAGLSCRGEKQPVTDLSQRREPVASLDGEWRFQRGDDADGSKGWASPSFDDGGWQVVRSDQSWGKQPAAAFTGTAWFRLRVAVPSEMSQTGRLAILMPTTFMNFELYADGQVICRQGTMPPHARPYLVEPMVCPLPPLNRAGTLAPR